MELKKILVGLEGIKAKGTVDLEIKGIEKNGRGFYLFFKWYILEIPVSWQTHFWVVSRSDGDVEENDGLQVCGDCHGSKSA